MSEEEPDANPDVRSVMHDYPWYKVRLVPNGHGNWHVEVDIEYDEGLGQSLGGFAFTFWGAKRKAAQLVRKEQRAAKKDIRDRKKYGGQKVVTYELYKHK